MASAAPGGGQTNLGLAPNVAGLLCNVPCCFGLVFSIVAAIVEKQSRFVRFHAFQSLLLYGIGIVLWFCFLLVGMVLTTLSGPLSLLLVPVEVVVFVGLCALQILLMVKANANEEFELPVLGKLARQWA